MSGFGNRMVEFDIANRSYRSVTLDEMDLDLHDRNKIYWVHYDLSDMTTFKVVADKLQLTEDAIDLCQSSQSMPMLLDTDDTITMQIQCLLSKHHADFKDENVENLILHLTSKYCFTASIKPLPPVIEFEHYYPKSLRYARTPCFIVFLIMDNTINDYGHILYDYELKTEEMNVRVSENQENIYHDVSEVKKELMKVKRYAVAIREILMRISGRKISAISDQCRTSLNNLFNQSQMISNEIDSMRDLLNGLLSQIDYSLMYRMNEVMKVLAAFAAIFLPMTLITGIYGMNFHWMPELNWQYGYYYALGLLALCGGSLLYLFKKNKWF